MNMCLIKVTPNPDDMERAYINIEAIGTIQEMVDRLEVEVNLDEIDGMVSEYLIYGEQKGSELIQKLMAKHM